MKTTSKNKKPIRKASKKIITTPLQAAKGLDASELLKAIEDTHCIRFSFKNIHPDFKRIKVNLFDLEKTNEGVLIEGDDSTSYERFKLDFSNKMSKLTKVRVFTDGLNDLSKRNLFRTIYCKSYDQFSNIRIKPCQLASKMSAYQFQSHMLDFATVGLELFTGNIGHEMQFEIYPETSISFCFYFNVKLND